MRRIIICEAKRLRGFPEQEAELPSVARRDLGGIPPCAIVEGVSEPDRILKR